MEELNIQNPYNRFSHKKYAFLATAIIILLYFLGGIISSVIQFSFVEDNLKKDYAIYSQGILQIVCLLLPTFYFAKKSLLPMSILMRKKSTLNSQQIVAAIIGIIAFQAFVSGFLVLQEKIIPDSILSFYQNIEKAIENMYLSILAGSGYLGFSRALLIGALIPAIAEETLFRGFLQSSLEQEYKPAKAIIITALIFSLLHMNPIGLIPLIGIGIYLGFVAYTTNNLLLPMLIHFINNTFAVIVIYSPFLSALDDSITDLSLINASLITISGLLLVLLSCYAIVKYSERQNENIEF